MSVDQETKEKGSRLKIANYQKILANNPRSFIFAQLAEEHIKLGEIDKAIEICQAGLSHNPQFTDGLYVLGVALFKQGNADQAKRVFLQILRSHPEYYLAREAMLRLGYDDERIQKELQEVPEEPIQILPPPVHPDAPPLDLAPTPEPPESTGTPSPSSPPPGDETAARKQRKEAALNQSVRRTIPSAPGDIRSAYKDGISPLPDTKSLGGGAERRNLWWILLAVLLGAAVLIGLSSYAGWENNRKIKDFAAGAREALALDTFEALSAAYARLEEGLRDHPDATVLAGLQAELAGRLLFDFDPTNQLWQARLEEIVARSGQAAQEGLFGRIKSLFASPFMNLSTDDPGQTLVAKGWRSLISRNWVELRLILNQAASEGFASPSILMLQADFHALEQKWDDSLALFTRAESADPTQTRPLYRRATILSGQKQWSAARNVLTHLLDKSPGHLRARILMSYVNHQTGTSVREIESRMADLLNREPGSLPRIIEANRLHLRAVVRDGLGDAPGALEDAAASAQLNPAPEVLYLQATLLLGAGRNVEAKGAIRQALALNPDDKRFNAFLGRLFFLEDNKTEALKHLEAAMEETGNPPDLLTMAGDAAAKLRMFDKAVEYYERALLLDGRNREIRKRLALALIEKQDLREARALIDRLMEEFPDDPLPYFLSGKYYQTAGKTQKADEEFERGLKLDPLNQEILLERVRLLFRSGDAPKGVRLLRNLTEAHPGAEEALALLATVAVASGATKTGGELYERLLKIRPHSPAYRLERAYLRALDGEIEEAKRVVEEELARDPNLGFGHILRGVFLMMEENPKQAEPQIIKGLQLDPRNAHGHFWLGKLKAAIQDTTWARNELELALDCQPIHPQAFFEIGRIHFEKAQMEPAREKFMRAYEIVSLFPEARPFEVSVMLRLGEIEFYSNRRNAGMAWVKRANALDPEAAEPFYVMARESDKFIQSAQAVAWLKRALQLDPKLGAAHYELGVIYEATGQTKAAREAFEQYLKLEPKGRFASDAQTHLERLH